MQFSISDSARFDFIQLFHWKRSIEKELWEQDHVVFVDINEEKNKILVGVSDISEENTVLNLSNRYNFPKNSISVIKSGRFVTLSHNLYDDLSNARGGMRARWETDNPYDNDSDCTTGPLVTLDGQNGFLFNTHCSDEAWDWDDEAWYNDEIGEPDDQLAFEQSDPDTWSNSSCPSDRCAYADALFAKQGSHFHNHGTIWRTVDRDPSSGSTEIDGVYDVTSHGSYASPGTVLDKVGYETGQTYGEVENTCVDVDHPRTDPDYPSGNVMVVCETFAKFGAHHGDSGSPVFRIREDGDVTFFGIMWGQNSSQEFRVFQEVIV